MKRGNPRPGSPEPPPRRRLRRTGLVGAKTARASFITTIKVPTPFAVGTANVHLIRREPITLVDAGPLTDEAWDALRAGLKSEGLGIEDIERVLLTHGHHDHFGLADRIAGVSGARLFGGALDRRPFAMQRNSKLLLDAMARSGFDTLSRLVVVASIGWIDRYAHPLAAWDALHGGEILDGDGYRVFVRSTPGHTPGSLTFEIPEAGILFTGDTVLHRITPNAVVVEDPEREGEVFRSLSRYFATLDAIGASNGSATLLTGHGIPIKDFKSHRTDAARRAGLRQQRIEAELKVGPRTIRELVSALFPRVTALNVFLAYSEILGFLMYLEDLGRVERLVGTLRDRYALA